MSSFRYPSREADARRRASPRPTSPRESPAPPPDADTTFARSIQRSPKQRNVQAVFDLNGTRYFSLRGRVYRCPPVPFRLGQRILDVYIKSLADAKQVAMTGAAAPTKSYYQHLAQLARLFWSHARPTSRALRVMRILHLTRNPFLSASEKELQEVTDFFLQGRTKSSVLDVAETMNESLTPMSSTNSKSS